MMMKRPRKGIPKRKRPRETSSSSVEKPGPIWTRPQGEGPIHPELDAQLAKPFLATIYIDTAHGFRFPLGPGAGADAIMEGLHKRMLNRYFRGVRLPEMRMSDSSSFRLPSSKLDGARADRVLEECIRTGKAPPGPGQRGCSDYATAVWQWWRDHGHVPVLAQLPVILGRFNVATAGDYFTIHRCPITQKCTLWLWELKTGWPVVPKKPGIMAPPLAAVWLTPENRWQLQVLLTRLAYERELGIHIDGGARVIHVWKQRDETKTRYECQVSVVEPGELKPANWTRWVDEDTLYESLSSSTYKK